MNAHGTRNYSIHSIQMLLTVLIAGLGIPAPHAMAGSSAHTEPEAQSVAPATTPNERHGAVYRKSACPFDTVHLDSKHLECGWLDVPEHRHGNDNRRIQLAVMIVHQAPRGSDKTPVVLLEDGPGVSAPLAVMDFMPKTLPGRDFVVLDLRGTGFSKPALCPWLNRTIGGELGRPGAYIGTMNLDPAEEALLKAGAIRSCRDRLVSKGIDPGAYNLSTSADDLEALRQALGYAKWNIFGTGYGARVAQIEMRRYPSGIRSVIMLPPEPIDYTTVAETSVSTFAAALKSFFALCRKNSECESAYPEIEKNYYRTIARLRSHPLHVPIDPHLIGTGEYVLNAQDFVRITRDLLAHGQVLVYLPMFIHAVHQSDMALLSPTINGLVKASVLIRDPHYRFSWGAFYADQCYSSSASIQRWKVAASHARSGLSLVGFDNAPCRYWSIQPAPRTELAPVHSSIPVLAEYGALDPTVSPHAVQHMLVGFDQAQSVVFPAGTHNPSSRNAKCMLSLIKAFVDEPYRKLDTSCAARLPPMTFKFGLTSAQQKEHQKKRSTGK